MENTTLKNCTPHTINLVAPDGATTAVLEPSGIVPRVQTLEEPVEALGGLLPVPVVVSRLGEVTDLPEPCEGTVLIVSQVVANAAPERRDLVFPTGLVRDDRGRVIGCTKLAQIPVPHCYQCDGTGIYEAGDFARSPSYCNCPAGRILMASDYR